MPAACIAVAVGPIISAAINNLLEIAKDRTRSLADVKDNLESLRFAVLRVQERLDQLHPRLINSTEWTRFVRKITKLCYNVEDIIDSIEQAQMRQHCLKSRGNSLSWVLQQGLTKLLNNDQYDTREIILLKLSRWGLPHKISTFLKKLENMEQDISKWPSTSTSNRSEGSHSQEVLYPPTALDLPQGRRKDKHHILQKLLEGVGVCIIGMAGIGKTTLARSILDDASVRDNFHIILWGVASAGINEVRALEFHRAKSNVSATRLLFVLDDVQDALPSNRKAWENFASSMDLLSESKTTTLLITTRDPRVALCTNTTPYYLKRMPDEDCEELVKRVVYPELNSKVDRNFFDHYSSRIAQKCMGLPLMADDIAYKLRNLLKIHAKAATAIRLIMKLDLWEFIRDRMLKALRFKNSSQKLLSYFSLFPHGHILSKEGLLQLWMAEGFIQAESWTNWENAANNHFDEILPAFMVEPTIDNAESNSPTFFQVLEITRMLSQSLASNMCSSINEIGSSSHPPTDTRHISVCCPNVDERLFLDIAKYSHNLRTFLLLHGYGANIHGVPACLFQKMSVLRVLDLSQSGITIVPETIGNLKHLRYLDLSHTVITKLPESICNLLALRILKLINCTQINHFPRKFNKLVNLIHLDLIQTRFCLSPYRVGRLTSLRTLHKFVVDKIKGHQISELQNMNALEGSIKIMHLENIKDKSEAVKASLYLKTKLNSIELKWTKSSMTEPSVTTKILNELEPPKNLEELRVTNYNGLEYPKWFDYESCHNLQTIHLKHWPCCFNLPPLWKLPVLTTLRLDTIHSLQHVGREFFGSNTCARGFASLEHLEILNMNRLARWDEMEYGDMPCLKDLKISNCPQLEVMPTLHYFSSLTALQILNCPLLTHDPDLPLALTVFMF